MEQNATRLNPQQQDMLRLFKTPMPEQDYNDIKRLVVEKLAKMIDVEMEHLEQENGWNADTYEQWGKEHMRVNNK